MIGIYLAAGKSSRFGSEKLLAPIQQKPLGVYALESAIESKLDRIVVVSKENDQLLWIPEKIHMSEKCIIKTCESSTKGLSHSLKCGLLEAEKLSADAIIVILADQPLITSLILNQLIINFIENPGASFVGIKMKDIITPPILIAQKLFRHIYQLQGDRGANCIIRKELENGLFISNLDDCTKFAWDVDTVADYEQLKLMNIAKQ